MNQRTIQYLLSLRDEASTKFEKFQQNLERGIQRASKRLDNFSRSFRAVTAGVLSLVGAIGFAATSTASYADEIDKMSQRTQLGTEFLQEMRYVTDQVGVNFDSMERTMDSFIRRIPQLEDGTSKSAQAWQRLNINLHDAEGRLRSTGDLYPEMIRRLAAMENETERNVIATQLLGRGASELIPLLNLSGSELERLTNRAHELGAVLDEDAIAAGVEFNDTIADLKTELQSMVREAGVSFIPMLQESIIPIIREQVLPLFRRGIELVVRLTESFRNMPSGAQSATLAILGLVAAASPAAFVLARLLTIVPALTAAFHAMLGPLGLVTAGIALAVFHTVRMRDRAAELNQQLLEQNNLIVDLADSYDTLTEAQLKQQMTELSASIMRMQRRIEELNEIKTQSHGLDARSAFELQVLTERSEEYIGKLIEMRQQLDQLGSGSGKTFQQVTENVDRMVQEGILQQFERVEMEIPETLERVEEGMTEVALNFGSTIRTLAQMMTQEFQQWTNFALDATHTLTDAFRMASDNRIAQIRAESDARIEEIDRQLERENLSEKEREQLRRQRETAERDMERRIARERVSLARRERAVSVVQSIINTALAVTRALAQSANPVFAAAVGALGAVQTGIIASQQIPSMHSGGTAIFDAPREQEALVRVRGQERLRVEPMDEPGAGQGGSVTVNITFNAPVDRKEWIKKGVEEGLRATGLNVDRYFVNKSTRVEI